MIDKYKNNIKKSLGFIKEIIGKSKSKIKKLSHKIVTDEKEIIDEKTIASKFNHFFVNVGLKLSSKISVSNTHFQQHVNYEGSNLERKDFCNEEVKKNFLN